MFLFFFFIPPTLIRTLRTFLILLSDVNYFHFSFPVGIPSINRLVGLPRVRAHMKISFNKSFNFFRVFYFFLFSFNKQPKILHSFFFLESTRRWVFKSRKDVNAVTKNWRLKRQTQSYTDIVAQIFGKHANLKRS